MSAIGSITGPTSLLSPVRPETLQRPVQAPSVGSTERAGFGEMLDGLVSTVSGKQADAADLTRRVLTGETDQLHQSVIAMQEASVAFGLMVEVRNKLVESYQELMRMQV
ncbi:MAG TPA: flagellar hook-basal body complex protein FliE [Opitutaceae bacterium]|nr:flagellar hook-basal body complex protein FliE [Opitutaceae bacterium]